MLRFGELFWCGYCQNPVQSRRGKRGRGLSTALHSRFVKRNTPMSNTQEHRGWQVAGAAGLFALTHSLLASRQAKRAAERALGRRRRDGLYRAAFVAKSLALTGLGAAWFLRQPDRELYRVPPPWSWLLRGVQAGSLAVLFGAVGTVGFVRFLGLRELAEWAGGGQPEREPEAQGPALGPDGELDARGPFRWTRHPDNLPVFGVLWCFPRMTVNRAALAAVFSVYAVLGSLHEDARLRAAYGAAFERYARAVPFMLPRPGRMSGKEIRARKGEGRSSALGGVAGRSAPSPSPANP
jgi:hypothetical protein